MSIFENLEGAVVDPENSDEVAAASSGEGDSLSGDPTGNSFTVTTYGDVADPDGGSAGGTTPPTTGIGSEESMIILADFSDFGHAYLLQATSISQHKYYVSGLPPLIETEDPVFWGPDDMPWFLVSVYVLTVFDPLTENNIEILLSPDGSHVVDGGFGGPGASYGAVGGGIRLSR